MSWRVENHVHVMNRATLDLPTGMVQSAGGNYTDTTPLDTFRFNGSEGGFAGAAGAGDIAIGKRPVTVV
jgi:hypothetical protein